MHLLTLPNAQDLIDEIVRAVSTDTTPPTVCLCGSTRFWEHFQEANLYFTAAGAKVLAPGVNMKGSHPLWAEPAAAEKLKQRLDRLHRYKIADADHVVVVHDGSGYIGDSTRGELDYAARLGVPTWQWSAG